MAIRTIKCKGSFEYEELEAGGAITPGMLIMVNSSNKVVVHATEGGRAEAAFAMENELQGETVSDAFASGEVVPYLLPHKGSCVNALLKEGESVSINDELISAGDGHLKSRDNATSGVTVQETIARAMEAKDLTGSSDTASLIEVRIA
jgi:hypothetical protein